MIQTRLKNFIRVPQGCLLVLMALSFQSAYAACNVSNSDASIGTYPSFIVDQGQVQDAAFHSGLSCTGLAAILNTTYLRYKVEFLSPYLTSSSGERLMVTVWERTDNSIVTTNLDKDLSKYSFTTFFSGPNGAVQMYARVPAGQNPVPGVYEGQLRIRWYYSVPRFAAIGLGLFHESPGFERGGFLKPFSWGDGDVSNMRIRITVQEDCVINTQPIDFGEAALATRFDTVTGTIKVRCSAKTPYTVGLSDGQSNNSQRYMRDNQNNRLNYEVYKGNGSARWGRTGAERWPSSQASVNAGIHDGKTVQAYHYSAQIVPNQSPNLPAGTYTDNLYLEVGF